MALIAVAGCNSGGRSADIHNWIWNENSLSAQLFLLDPGYFGSQTSDGIEPTSTIYSDNLSIELKAILTNIRVFPPDDGPFPACTPEPGQQYFYLIVEQDDESLRRIAEENGCGYGYAASSNAGYFQQAIVGVITPRDFCEIAGQVGVTSPKCS